MYLVYEISLHVDLHNARLKKRWEPDAQGPTLFANPGRVVSSGRVSLAWQQSFFLKFFFETEGQSGQSQWKNHKKKTRPHWGEAGLLGRETPPTAWQQSWAWVSYHMVRYVGFIQFFFKFSNFYQLDLHNKTCVALANLRWSIIKNCIETWTSPHLVKVIKSACLLAS